MARETMRFAAGQCVGYEELFVSGDSSNGAYVCQLTITSEGFTLVPGGPAGAFVAPAAREHGSPVGGAGALTSEQAHAAAWSAARAQALAPARIAALYATYQASKKNPAKVRSQAEWWGITGQRGGVRHTIEGSIGEYQADKLFAMQGHTKLSHAGIGLLDQPQGPGLDGVWRNATPPPEFIITETKTTTQPGDIPCLSKGQMSNAWVLRGKRLSRAVGEKQAKQIQLAMLKGQVSKRVLHIDRAGQLTQYTVDAAGKMSLLT